MVHIKADADGRLHAPGVQLADSRSEVGRVLPEGSERCSVPEYRQDGELQKHVGPHGAKHQCTLRFLYWE